MIRLVIEKESGINLFSLTLDGGDPIRSDQNRLLTIGNLFNFKTGTGANIIQQQRILYDEVEVIDGGSFTFTSTIQLWNKLKDIGFFDGVAISGGGSGASSFLSLSDTPNSYIGADGYALVVNESQQKVEFQPLALFTPDLLDKLNAAYVMPDMSITDPNVRGYIANKPDFTIGNVSMKAFSRLTSPQQDFEIPVNTTAKFAIVNGAFFYLEDANTVDEQETFTQSTNIVTFKNELETGNLVIIFYQ